ncbi:MAG: hypothetical protein JO022_07065, partial [Acidobacteriaceae bacterium]|nr:hypothetical protein [Acidobacteriaceae bacterium]
MTFVRQVCVALLCLMVGLASGIGQASTGVSTPPVSLAPAGFIPACNGEPTFTYLSSTYRVRFSQKDILFHSKSGTVRMTFAGSGQRALLRGEESAGSTVHLLRSGLPASCADLPVFKSVRYEGLYAGI